MLTEDQKKYIHENYRSMSVLQIIENLGEDLHKIRGYMRRNNLKILKHGQLSSLTDNNFFKVEDGGNWLI